MYLTVYDTNDKIDKLIPRSNNQKNKINIIENKHNLLPEEQ
jgi:hypothetical protein